MELRVGVSRRRSMEGGRGSAAGLENCGGGCGGGEGAGCDSGKGTLRGRSTSVTHHGSSLSRVTLASSSGS